MTIIRHQRSIRRHLMKMMAINHPRRSQGKPRKVCVDRVHNIFVCFRSFFCTFFFKLRQLYTTSKFQINRRFVFFVYIRQRFLQFVLLSEIRIQINSFILTPPIRIQKKNKKNHYVRKTSFFTFINDPIPPQPFSTYSIYMSNHFWVKNILKKKRTICQESDFI